MGYRWGRDGGEELRDGGLRWIGCISVSFARCRKVSAFACGGTGGERDVAEDWAAFGGEMGSSGSWLFHTSQCKALQVCSGRVRELGTGSSAGSSS